MSNKLHCKLKFNDLIISSFILLSLLSFILSQDPYIRVNSNISDNQDKPAIIVNKNKNQFIIFWQSYTDGDLNFDVYGKIFDINGKSITGDTLINNFIQSGDQSETKAGFLNEDKIIVVWHSNYNGGYKIQGRFIDSKFSTNNSEFQIDSPNDNNNKLNVSLILLSNERFIVIYNYEINSKFDLYGAVYNSNQEILKTNFKINIRAALHNFLNPSCAEFSDNTFVIVYPSNNETSTNLDIYAKIFDSNYNCIKDEFKINTNLANDQNWPIITLGPKNEVFIAFESNYSYQWDIQYIIYNKDFSQILIKEDNLNSDQTGGRGRPFISKIDQDNNLICWNGGCSGCTAGNISCRIVDFQGNFVTADLSVTKESSKAKRNFRFSNFDSQQFIFTFPYTDYSGGVLKDIYLDMNYFYQRVNTVPTDDLIKPFTISLNNGGFLILWLCEKCSGSSNTIRFKTISQNGTALTSDMDIGTIKTIDTNDFSAISLVNGNIFLVWDSYRDTTYLKDIYGSIRDVTGKIIKSKFQIPLSIDNDQSVPKIATNKNGLNLVIWNVYNPSQNQNSVYGRFFNDSGETIGDERNIVNTNIQQKSNLCYIGNDKFLVLYDNLNNSFNNVYGIIVSNTVNSIDIGIIIDKDLSNNYINAGCALIGQNRIAIIFNANNQVYYKIYNSIDNSIFKEQTIIDASINPKNNPSIINLITGGFVIGWEESDTDGSGLGVFYKSFDDDGLQSIQKTLANTFTYKDQKQISLAQLTDKSIVIVFSSYGDGDKNGIFYDFIINCPSNRFIDSIYNNRCSVCDSPCSTCKGTAKFCTSCIDGYYSLEPNQNNCVNTPIPSNYLQNPTPSNRYYLKCSDMCSTCINVINNCQTCKSLTAKLVEISIGLINCLEDTSGYFLPSNLNYYKKCPINCSTCTSETNCNSCSTGFFLAEVSPNNINCISSLDEYYKSSNSTFFQKCSSPCLKCIGSSINCSKCDSNNYLAQIDNSNFNCINDITGYYLENSSYYIKCPSSCKTCTSANYCTSCSLNYYLIDNNVGNRICLDNTSGYYLPINGVIYKKCSSICQNCANYDNNCISCENTKKLAESSRNSLTKTCISNFEGYYLDPQSPTQFYKICSENCKTCENSQNNCKTCNLGFYIALTASNSFECIDNITNFFLVPGQNYFQKCAEKCATCIDASKCLSCNTNKFYISIKNTSECIQGCPEGYWQNFLEKNCQLCDPSCKKCLDNTKNCLTCSEGYFPLKENKSLCFKECPYDYKFNDIEKYCERACISNCKTCTDSINCIECNENYYLIASSNNLNNCVANCPDGFYNDKVSLKCQTCPRNCKTCINVEQCLSCKNEYFFQEENKLCLNNCPIRYYSQVIINDNNKINESKNICKKCKPECFVCTGSQDNCLSCEQGYFYYAIGKECLVDCPQGFYKNFITNQCQICDLSCLECVGNLVNDCIKCNEIEGLKLNNGLCIKDSQSIKLLCPLGFIEIDKNCIAYKTCIQNFSAYIPRIFSIDIDDFIIEIDLTLKNECKMFWNRISIKWDKDNPFYNNSKFSKDLKILSIKSEILKEGNFNFIIRLFFDTFQIVNLTVNSKFQVDKVSNLLTR